MQISPWPRSRLKIILNSVTFERQAIILGHFGKYHNTLCLSPQMFHKHCFQFLLGLTMVPRENKNNAHAKFGGTKKNIMVFSEVAYLRGNKDC